MISSKLVYCLASTSCANRIDAAFCSGYVPAGYGKKRTSEASVEIRATENPVLGNGRRAVSGVNLGCLACNPVDPFYPNDGFFSCGSQWENTSRTGCN
jgi:hypothetical protein